MLVDIAIPRTKLDFLTYNTKDKLKIGDLVLLPLRKKKVFGIVIKTDSENRPPRLRDIYEVRQQGFISPSMVHFYRWLAHNYLASAGEVLTLALPRGIFSFSRRPAEDESTPWVKDQPPALTPNQQQIVNKILKNINERQFKPYLLFGVTGSGKTEIYLRIIEEVIGRGRKSLVMVPEISMTPLLLGRFKKRFGHGIVTIHSSLPPGQRKDVWHKIREGRYDVVIGPRSCIFLPIPELDVIVVDEEHDESYKEEARHPRYNGRDAAVIRGQIEKCTVILGSATPSIESYHKAKMGEYELVLLRERIDARPLPKIEVVDLKKESDRFLSHPFRETLDATISRDEQAIIFLNRRGYAPVLLCSACGFVAKCPFCNLPLVFHKAGDIVTCHFCQYRKKAPDICPACQNQPLVFKGLGTQRLEEILGGIMKKDDVLRFDHDSVSHKGRLEEILHEFEANRAKILMGTQMVTKGFDFPNVTMVGIINADQLFNFPDFRGAERTFQLLTQVAGRAGRGKKEGVVVIQTYHPQQYAIVYSQRQDYEAFYNEEIKLRSELSLPPFSRLIILRIFGKDKVRVREAAEKIVAVLKLWQGLVFYGPKESFRFRIRKMFRYFILIKIDKEFPIERFRFLLEWKESGVRLDIDVDPQEVI